jgi:GT2 family glycosyltransferase
MLISVIIPTYNRPRKLAETVGCFREQTIPASDYEIIVVDDASAPPATLPESARGPRCTLIRFNEMLERAVARNTAVEAARGELVLFSDDDLKVGRDFLESHIRAHEQWPGALVTGKIILPPESLDRPGCRFRQQMELSGLPPARGPVASPNFGTAANMSIARQRYRELGGFDPAMVGIEDQDFSLRHSAAGGTVVFLPEAVAIHDDDWLDFRSFCRRQAWASECTVALAGRYPDLPDNTPRALASGPVRWGRDPAGVLARKLVKSALGHPPALATLFAAASLLERIAPASRGLDSVYRLLLGIHLQNGYRKGLRRNDGAAAPAPASLAVGSSASQV